MEPKEKKKKKQPSGLKESTAQVSEMLLPDAPRNLPVLQSATPPLHRQDFPANPPPLLTASSAPLACSLCLMTLLFAIVSSH